MKKVIINKNIMQEAFDYKERQSYWQEKVTKTYADMAQKEAQAPPVEMAVVVVNKGRVQRLRQYAAAASVALLVLSVWALNISTPKKDSVNELSIAETLIDEERELESGTDRFQATIVRKGSNDTDTWQSDFQSAKYTDVIQTLEKVGNKRTVEQAYYLAHAYLKMNPKNTDKAQPLLKSVSEANSDYAQDALWYYALICKQRKQDADAKIALDKVIKESSIYGHKARQLRTSLK